MTISLSSISLPFTIFTKNFAIIIFKIFPFRFQSIKLNNWKKSYRNTDWNYELHLHHFILNPRINKCRSFPNILCHLYIFTFISSFWLSWINILLYWISLDVYFFPIYIHSRFPFRSFTSHDNFHKNINISPLLFHSSMSLKKKKL